MTDVMDRIISSQDQFVELVASFQKPVVAAVQRTARFVDERAAQLPKLPFAEKLFDAEKLPTASQIVEAQFAFAQKLLDTNKKFAVEVAKVVGVTEAAPKAAKAAKAAK